MDPIGIALLSIIALFILILAGVHIAFVLASLSFIGIWLITGNLSTALSILATTSYEAVRDYVFAVVPLFILMGCLMSNTGSAEDLFGFANKFTKRIPAGMSIATIAANTIFAAVTGVSVASAAVFSKVALPEMIKLNYGKSFAVGTIAGSSVLGMLIPPSVLMIIYGMLASVSIGKLFMAGVVPGLILAGIYSIGVVTMTILWPEYTGAGSATKGASVKISETRSRKDALKTVIKPLPVVALIILVLGGIWGGFFTPTEASAIGALGALAIGIVKKTKIEGYKKSLLQTASSTSVILFLMISAQMYSRMLTVSGVVNWLTSIAIASNLSSYLLLTLFVILWLFLGCIIDSTSILLLTMPLILPIAEKLGFDLIWFGIVAIITIEVGLLTPPFGMVIFAIKATLGDLVTVQEIIWGSVPFILMMMLALLIVIAFPGVATWLPGLM
jgi:C4-dicarboxylate transporter, DctM subunit